MVYRQYSSFPCQIRRDIFIINSNIVRKVPLGSFRAAQSYYSQNVSKPLSINRVLTDCALYQLMPSIFSATLGSARVVDLGCGKGIYYNFLTKIVPSNKGLFYTGIDLTPSREWDSISVISEGSASFQVADLCSEDFKIPENSNVIFSHSCFEHIKSVDALNSKIAKKLFLIRLHLL